MSVKSIEKGSRKDRNGLPIERQDNRKKYEVTSEMLKKGSLNGKHPIYVPKLRMVIYTKHPEMADELIDKYVNRSIPFLDEKKETQIKAI